jgi:uncharacterized protein (TIGR00106 family)
MSVMLEFAMFPTDKGGSVSEYVSRILKIIDRSGLSYQLTPMGTIVEADELSQVLDLVGEAYSQLEPDCNRVYSSLKLDIRKGAGGRLKKKIESVEQKVGKKLMTSC